MKLSKPYELKDICNIIDCTFEGEPSHKITGINEVHVVQKGDIVFVDHPKYYEKAVNSNATTIIINPIEDRKGKDIKCPEGKAFIISKEPFIDYNKLVKHFQPTNYSTDQISKTAKIHNSAIIMPGVYLGNNVEVGKNCIIHPNVVIYNNCIVKNNVIIHANTVIGADAFYYKKRDTEYEKMISCGRVILEDNVEIGALCTIDKGVSGDTIIGKGTIIDNQVQIGHDTTVGEMCLLASQVGVSGTVTIKNKATLWGQAGTKSDITIGEGATLLAQAGLAEDIPDGKAYFGSPAGDARSKMREVAALKRLPDLIRKIK